MQQTTEKEYKCLVNKSEYEHIRLVCESYFDFIKQLTQINYYYDTVENLFNKAKTTVRVRQKEDQLKLQVKKHSLSKENMFVSEEYNSEISNITPTINMFNFNEPLVLKGVLVTNRTVYSFGINSMICLDVNMYLGDCDYEVELEFSDEDLGLAKKILNNFGLKDGISKCKSARFFERLCDMELKINDFKRD